MLVEIDKDISKEESIKIANRNLQDSEEGKKTIKKLEDEVAKKEKLDVGRN